MAKSRTEQNKVKAAEREKDEMKGNVVGRENREESVMCVTDVEYNEGQN